MKSAKSIRLIIFQKSDSTSVLRKNLDSTRITHSAFDLPSRNLNIEILVFLRFEIVFEPVTPIEGLNNGLINGTSSEIHMVVAFIMA